MKGAYFHAIQTNDQIGHVSLGSRAPKICPCLQPDILQLWTELQADVVLSAFTALLCFNAQSDIFAIMVTSS